MSAPLPRKTCTKCGVEQSVRGFYRAPRGRLGYMARCKPCHLQEVEENRALKADYYRAYYQRRDQEPARKDAKRWRNLKPSTKEARVRANRVYRRNRKLFSGEVQHG